MLHVLLTVCLTLCQTSCSVRPLHNTGRSAKHLLRGIDAGKQPLEDVAAAPAQRGVLHQGSPQPNRVLGCQVCACITHMLGMVTARCTRVRLLILNRLEKHGGHICQHAVLPTCSWPTGEAIKQAAVRDQRLTDLVLACILLLQRAHLLAATVEIQQA